ncbi:MAG: PAS domain-containing protein, partial [Desulfonatronovibrionaceae bacterium]
MLEKIRTNIGYKIGLNITAISIGIFSLITAVMLIWQRNLTEEQLTREISRFTDLLKVTIERPMVIGDDEGTRQEFAHLARRYEQTRAYLTDFRGNITYSTEDEAVSKAFSSAVGHEDIARLADQALERELISTGFYTLEDRDVYLSMRTVPNAPECYHCHGSSQPILGNMVVVQDVSKTLKAMRSNTMYTSLMILAGILVLVFCVYFFMRRQIFNPIIKIDQAAQKVARGDFSADFSIGRKDQLASLAEHLGIMVRNLKKELGFSKGMLNTMTTPCLVCDTQARITFVNSAALELLGHDSSHDFIGQPPSRLVYGDDRETATDLALKNMTPILDQEMELTNHQGRHIHIKVDAAPLYDLDHQLIGAFVLYTDLTDIKKQQEQIENKNRSIENSALRAEKVAEQLSSASEELSAQVEQASRGAEEQKNMASTTASSMEEMNATVMDVARNASQAAEASDKVKLTANSGAETVHEAVKAIAQVQSKALGLKKQISSLGQQAEGIGKIMNVIEDIADQTNLLALNAAIEA